MKPKKKKEIWKGTYRKDTVLPLYSIKEMLKANTTNGEIDVHIHRKYDDGTQSVNITIHYTPSNLTNN